MQLSVNESTLSLENECLVLILQIWFTPEEESFLPPPEKSLPPQEKQKQKSLQVQA